MAATTIATMAMLNAKCINNISSPKSMIIASSSSSSSTKTTSAKPSISLLTTSKPPSSATLAAGTAIAGAIFSTLSTCEPAFAVQQIADIAESTDNRGLALLLPIIPALAWVLFNILQPALNQINKMRSTKGVIVGLGGAGLGASGFMVTPPHASASASVAADQMAMIAAAAGDGSDNRGQLLLFVVAPAILWVLYNILQPALNQINKMRS